MRIVKPAEERKNEILDVAEQLFAEKGFDNALDVMRKLGVPEEKIQEAKAMQEKVSNK